MESQQPQTPDPTSQASPVESSFLRALPSQDQRVRAFIDRWQGRGREKQESQQFWTELLEDVLQRDDLAKDTHFEYPTSSGGYIDVLIPNARLLIEQKGANINLDELESRRGTMVTPIQQAMGYVNDLPYSLKPRWVCTCNFTEFRFWDLDEDSQALKEPFLDFSLTELGSNLKYLIELFDPHNSRVCIEQQLSLKASGLVAGIHSSLYDRYVDPESEESHTSLALLTMRIVFCLYAEDAGLFSLEQFSDYVQDTAPEDLREALIQLFATLDTPEKERSSYLKDSLKDFPYVDGGLFGDEIEIPNFDETIKDSIIEAGKHFDWMDINPVIFGSLMEETLSHAQRRQGGMHYTSPENIHRVIDPLFLDDLKAEFRSIVTDTTISERKRESALDRFHEKIAGLQFLDPACGSGNFLTETYLCLRELEDQIIQHQQGRQGAITLGTNDDPILVSIGQMHGIEINGFAVSIAKTALWIAEQQSYTKTIAMLPLDPNDRLPLKDAGHIVQGNALRMDWNSVLPAGKCSYVMGNPPFVGHVTKSADQTRDLRQVWGKDYAGYLDYSTCWYKKADGYLASNPSAVFAFVSTNSITQGQPVINLFQPLGRDGWRIRFAHRTFAWNSESSDEAHVHVVIIGMDQKTDRLVPPVLYTYEILDGQPIRTEPHHINGYLLDAPDVYVGKRSQKQAPLSSQLNRCDFGSMPLDNGNLLLNSRDEYARAMKDPIAAKYVRPFRMGKELIHNTPRWCLWMVWIEPSQIRHSPFLAQRVQACKDYRSSAVKTGDAYKNRETPWLFRDDHQPRNSYVAVPEVFSHRREWATCDWYPSDIIAGNQIYTCDDPTGFNFAIIESHMFMAWQKGIGGRLKSDYRFSNTVVWNNLPLPPMDEGLKSKIIEAGGGYPLCAPESSWTVAR